ncbi:MAG: PorT family protein, partial [Pedobacter sp.]|nr:PorT family protein [Pedobacter sp.]
MKNSAWYYRLWYKKLDKLPLKTDANASWLGMQRMLDLHAPVGGNAAGTGNAPGSIKIPKPLGSKIVSLLGYVLPAAAMIGGAVYFTSTKPVKKAVPSAAKNENQVEVKQTDSSVITADTLLFSDLHLRDSLQKLTADPVKVTINETDKNTANSDTEGVEVSGENAAVAARNSIGPATKSSASRKVSEGKIAQQQQQQQQQSHHFERIKPGTDRPVNSNALVEKEKSADIKLNNQVVLKEGNTTEDKRNPKSVQIESSIVDMEEKINSSSATQDKNSVNNKTDKQTLDKKNAAVKKAGKAKKTGKTKEAKAKLPSSSAFSYGLNSGLNIYSQGSGIYLGVFGDYIMNNRLMFGAGLRVNSGRTLSDSYMHPSFSLKDSVPEFNVDDTRKLFVLDLPLSLSYKITKSVSIKAGPVLSIVAKQSNVNTKFSAIISNRDTTYKGVIVEETVPQSTVNKIGLGFSGAVSFHLKQFDLEAGYQVQRPFKVKNELGTYQKPA